MGALVINGFSIPVSAWREGVDEFGERGRAYSGKAWSSVHTTKRKWTARVRSVDPRELESIRCLVLGEGFNWSFNADFFADGKGLPPIPPTTGASLVGGVAPVPKFGAKFLQMDASQYLTYQGDAQRGYVWTVALWLYEAGAWHHYVISYDNGTWRKWRDGASVGVGYPTGFVSVNNSGQLVVGQNAVANKYDDVIWYPCLWPDSWAAALHARGAAYPNIPKLEIVGDLMPSASLVYSCRGLSVGESDAINRGTGASTRFESMDIAIAEE